MQTATASVKLNNNTTLQRSHLTPAEVVVLNHIHAINNGNVFAIFLEADVERSNLEELQRLRSLYGPVVNEIYPGVAPVLPTTFESAGLTASVRSEPLPTAEPLTKLALPDEWLAADNPAKT